MFALKEKYPNVPDETLTKFLGWMEAGGFIEVHHATTVIWKGGYQFAQKPYENSWPFCSFNG